jgi:hypothetical protein
MNTALEFANNLFLLMEETFEARHHGIYLDKGTSFLKPSRRFRRKRRMDKLFHENPTWNEDSIGGALSIVIHTAYHLGEIRQALCTVK